MEKAELDRRARIVVTDYKGIQPPFVAFYVEAIIYAAGRSKAAFERFADQLHVHASTHDIVASAHEALGHAAALSRFFFPADKKALSRARGSHLRRIFAVSNSSALQDRELRNALEHFDERLDEYLLGDIAGHIFPGPMVNDASLADDPIGHIFRLVDPKTDTFVLLGNKHPFRAMRQEVERISAAAPGLR